MNKKGFISISVVYTFFLVFIAIILGIIAMYSNRRIMLLSIKDDVREILDKNTHYNCFSKGITRLNECIIESYGGVEAIESQSQPEFKYITTYSEYGLYSAADDYGTSYYFRGAVPDNYVKFGQDYNGDDMYWRIVRINGDGTIRLIFDGYNIVENGVSHVATVGFSEYNLEVNDHKYVGYTYDSGGSQVDSAIKTKVDEWYKVNLYDYYHGYIADTLFCNDRTKENEGVENFLFGSAMRLDSKGDPTFFCNNKSDRYTVSDVSRGNGLLKYPVGLITADELVFAGSVVSNTLNSNSYINSNEMFWTMSPYNIDDKVVTVPGADVYRFINGHIFCRGSVGNTQDGIRPVINLRADVDIKKGNGTVDNPYILEEFGY